MNTNQTISAPEAVEPQLHIISAGLVNGKWGIVLSNGMELEGVQEIIQTKPSGVFYFKI